MKCEHTKCVNNDDVNTSDPPLVQEAELGGGRAQVSVSPSPLTPLPEVHRCSCCG